MKTLIIPSQMNNTKIISKEIFNFPYSLKNKLLNNSKQLVVKNIQDKTEMPEILIISSYPPRECGIATYSQDLKNSITDKFGDNVKIKICALENKESNFNYSDEVKYKLITSNVDEYKKMAIKINSDQNIFMVFLQHEFGLFGGENGNYIFELLVNLTKPVAVTFHTILPNPNIELRKTVRKIAKLSDNIIIMSKNSESILINDYKIDSKMLKVIQHGTHLISSKNISRKSKLYFGGRTVLSTFGLISEGKSIETALKALPKIIEKFPNVLYLIIGKTHPEVIKNEGEKYRESLYNCVLELNLQNNVRFVNKYLSLAELTDYLQRTDIYMFTSKNPNQAISGTLAYAMACGCPIISTPIPHAKELLDGAGVNFDFQNSNQLADETIKLLFNPKLLEQMRSNALHKISPTAWQNSAIAHIELAKKISKSNFKVVKYHLPVISLNHIKRLTTSQGMIQFSKIDEPDLESGYTLDDNARALIAVTKHYELFGDEADLELINTYLNFILFCQTENGNFLNYVDKNGNFFDKNKDENLEDSNGRAIWALGNFMSYSHLFNKSTIDKVKVALNKSLININKFQSPRAISFAIKGLYHYNLIVKKQQIKKLITTLADNLVSKYRGVSDDSWQWYEEYLTYANSLLPQAMLCASLATGSDLYKDIAKKTFDFLLNIIYKDNQIKVISNQGWHQKGGDFNQFGEQPIDVAYTVLALNQFYEIFKEQDYLDKSEIAFNWFLGKNHLSQIIYNPVTGGCYDGLEENHVNLNQGAESTVSYLLARLTFEKSVNSNIEIQLYEDVEKEYFEKTLNEVELLS